MAKQQSNLTETGRAYIESRYESFLMKWPESYIEHRIATPFGKTFVLESKAKDKIPLVLLHGSGENSTMWYRYWARLSHTYHIYAIDIPGELGRSVPEVKIASSSFYPEWLHAVFLELKIEQSFIAGISTGANIALLMASYYPDYVKGVLAMVPFGVISGISLAALLKILLLNINYSEKKQAALFRYLNGQPLSGKEGIKQIEIAVRNRLAGNRIVTIPPFKFKNHRLMAFEVPCLCVLGECDPLYNAKAVKREMDSLDCKIKVQVVPGKGHFLDFNVMPYFESIRNLFLPVS